MAEKSDSQQINKDKLFEMKEPGSISSKINKVNLNTELNIVLSKEQIEKLLKELVDIKAFDPGMVAFFSGYCCIDVSVGSSVAGPVTGVGSSISIDPDIRVTRVQERLNAEQINIELKVPQNVRIK